MMTLAPETSTSSLTHGVRIGIVIPVRNRKHYTQAILTQLTQQLFAQPTIHQISVVVIDDGSSDGTPELIAQQFPQIHLLLGDGELWWTGAIATGMNYATQTLQVDYITWLNDDITLADDFIPQLIWQCQHNWNRKVITGGIIRDQTHLDWVVFGGVVASQPINNIHQFDAKAILSVDTLNGNIVVMPARLVTEIGLPDTERFRHYGGDYEYICRAKEQGYSIQLSSLLQATTDYQPEDVIRYMPLWIQLYFKHNPLEKWQVFSNLSNLKSPHNVSHMVNSIYRKKAETPRFQYQLFYFKKIIKLLGSECIPRQIRRQKIENHFKKFHIPQDVIEQILSQ